MDTTKITDPEGKRFIQQFFSDRTINREFYERVPENKFDYRMVDTPQRKSDSPRESLAHQIDTERDYINGVKTGELHFGVVYDDLKTPNALSKTQLLQKLQEEDEELIKVLSNPDIANKRVKVPWSETSIPAIASLWAMDSHEILHTGWNLAVMDHLNIERFPALKQIWG